jgi:hypothetical protein
MEDGSVIIPNFSSSETAAPDIKASTATPQMVPHTRFIDQPPFSKKASKFTG